MTNPSDRLTKAGVLDPEWYRATYPDVMALRMDPEAHFLRYGSAMGREPREGLSFPPEALAALDMRAPEDHCELVRAYELGLKRNPTAGVLYAGLHTPAELAYTTNILQANVAIQAADEAGWLHYLNAYLAQFDTAPVRLQKGQTLLERLTTDRLINISGGPLVSVIMPAKNAQDTVTASARSILTQTWTNLELLIIDDCSEDQTWAKLTSLAATDRRVKIFRNKVNVGPYVCKNMMLAHAKGQWVTGQDADDWSHPERLTRHIRAIQSHAAPPRASLGYMTRLKEDGSFTAISPRSTFSPDGVTKISSISTMFERKFLTTDIGYWDSVRFGGDTEMIERVRLVIGEEFKHFAQIGMLCISHPGSLTNHPEDGVFANEGGLSIARTQYKESWEAVHRATSVEQLDMPFPQIYRRYKCPERMAVAPEVIAAALVQ